MKNPSSHDHPSAERMQAFLDGELAPRAASAFEEHVASCPRCASELDGWRVLFEDLGDLGSVRPPEGFAERVMADLSVAGAGAHVGADVLQDLVDGVLPARQVARVESHLRACSACTEEADAWLGIARRLDALEHFAPSAGFTERVMAAVEVPERVSALARLVARVRSVAGTPAPEHVPAGILQDFVDGTLPTRAVARVEAHLEGCTSCATELRAWQSIDARLETLEHYAPREGFADRVLERVRARQAARAVASQPAWTRLLAAASRLAPRSRDAWAALSGIAVTPAVVAGLVGWAVFSHPTLTVGSLLSFLFWQVTDLAGALLGSASTVLAQAVAGAGAGSLLDALAAAPMMVAGGVLIYSLFCALALRVLYKNLLARRPAAGRFAHVSTAS